MITFFYPWVYRNRYIEQFYKTLRKRKTYNLKYLNILILNVVKLCRLNLQK